MPKISKSKASWQLGWTDGLEHKVGRNMASSGIDQEAYLRGAARAAEFIERISATRPPPRRDVWREPV